MKVFVCLWIAYSRVIKKFKWVLEKYRLPFLASTNPRICSFLGSPASCHVHLPYIEHNTVSKMLFHPQNGYFVSKKNCLQLGCTWVKMHFGGGGGWAHLLSLFPSPSLSFSRNGFWKPLIITAHSVHIHPALRLRSLNFFFLEFRSYHRICTAEKPNHFFLSLEKG